MDGIKKNKVAFFVSNLGGGGAEKNVIELLRGINKKDLNLSIVLKDSEGVFIKDIPASVSVLYLKKASFFFEAFQIVSLIKNNGYDIFVPLLPKESIISLFAKFFLGNKVKLVVLVQTTLSQIKFTSIGKGRDRLFSQFLLIPLVKLLYPLADKIICVSNGVAEDLYKIIGKSPKVEVIYNTLNAGRILELSKESVDDELLSKDCFNILAAGRLIVAKDYPTLIRAVYLVLKEKLVRLIILGDGVEKDNLLAMVKELGIINNVLFGGFKDNPYKYMARADILVLSSIREGFGNVIAEAMVCGTPVISTNCKYGPGEIIEDGVNGLLTPVGDEKMLAEAILKLLCNKGLREKLSNEGKKIPQKFSFSESVEGYENLFKKLLK